MQGRRHEFEGWGGVDALEGGGGGGQYIKNLNCEKGGGA